MLLLRDESGRSRTYRHHIANLRFEGIMAGAACLKDEARRYQMRLRDESKNCDVQPSTSGQLVHCSYELEIRADLSGCTCCSPDPSVKCFITILSPPLVFAEVPAPSGWNPQVFAQKEVVFSQGNLYTANAYP